MGLQEMLEHAEDRGIYQKKDDNSGQAKAQIIEQMLLKSKRQRAEEAPDRGKLIVDINDPEPIEEEEDEEDGVQEDDDILDIEHQRRLQSKLEERLVEDFLRRFVVISEKSTLDHVDLVLMLRALPNQIVDYNLEQNELFNFKIFQNSLIAFLNLDIVNAFEYFDSKNRERTTQIRDMLIN